MKPAIDLNAFPDGEDEAVPNTSLVPVLQALSHLVQGRIPSGC